LGRNIRYAGAPYVFSDSPWSLRRRPPLTGEHTAEILRDELGLTVDEIAALAVEGII
jgi:crotonobetainyl-CoA:carnitine CoA-transferase CaiB-like acyl-CoA transferase